MMHWKGIIKDGKTILVLLRNTGKDAMVRIIYSFGQSRCMDTAIPKQNVNVESSLYQNTEIITPSHWNCGGSQYNLCADVPQVRSEECTCSIS